MRSSAPSSLSSRVSGPSSASARSRMPPGASARPSGRSWPAACESAATRPSGLSGSRDIASSLPTNVAGGPHAGHVGAAGGVGGDVHAHPRRVVGAGRRPRSARNPRGRPSGSPTTSASRGHDRAVGQPHAGEPVVGDLDARDLAVDDADAAGRQLLGLLVGRAGARRG